LWRFFTQEHTVEEGVTALCGEYEVDAEIAKADVEKFVETIIQNGFAE
jgi:hypothetical protein